MLQRLTTAVSHAVLPLCATSSRAPVMTRAFSNSGSSSSGSSSGGSNSPPPPMPLHPAAQHHGMGKPLPQPTYAPGGAPADEEDAEDFIEMWVDGPVPAPVAPAATDAAAAAAGDMAEAAGAEAAAGATLREWGGPTKGGSMPEPTRFGDWERKGRCTDF